MSVIITIAWAGWALLLIFLLGGHDYYDHVHYLPHHPCGALMCGCDTYKKEPRP